MPKGVPLALPSRKQLQHWETVCRYLDSQPYRAVKHPFPAAPPMSVKLFKRMARFRLVRHIDLDCTYRLARNWEAILRRLWAGCPDDDAPSLPVDDAAPVPFVVDRNVDTFYISLLVPSDDDDLRVLPERLAGLCDQLKAAAQAADGDVETPWRLFDAPLNLWKAGVGTSGKGKGISWSFLLRNDLVMLRLRRAPLGQLLGSVRLSAKLLWSYGPRGALDAVYALVHEMWGDETAFAALTWQVAQVHLCVDVAHFRPEPADLARVVSHTRKRAIHIPSFDDEETSLPGSDDIDNFLDLVPDGWDDLPDALFDDGFGDVDESDDEGDDESDDDDDETQPADAQGAAIYLYGQRASGFAFSPGAAISAAWYDKELEERLSGKLWMRPIHEAGGWRVGMALFRVEGRFGRDVLREIQQGLGTDGAWVADPWLVLDHLGDLWGYFVGLPPESDHAPDVTHRGWLRLAVPIGNKRSQWPTDPVWETIQRIDFAQVSPPLPLTRGHIAVHDPRAIDAEIYGLLKLRAVIHRRQMDRSLTLSMELRAFVDAIEGWEAATGREFWREVREKARSLGQPVPMLPAGVLPFQVYQKASKKA
jgi:hypothetical protein